MAIQKEIDKYLDWKSSYTNKAPATYRLHLKRFDEFINKELENITLENVILFQLHLKERYSLANVAYSITIIKNFFEFWRRQGIRCVDSSLIKIPRFIPNSHAPIYYDEFVDIDNSIPDDGFDNTERKVVIRLLWETGMRVSELCDMNVSDIETRRPAAMIVTKKNNQMRWVFWSAQTHELLIKYLGVRICMNSREELFIAPHMGEKRRRITTRTIQRWIKESVRNAGINKNITPHSFRHGKAHRILDLGGTVKDVQMILGHSENNPKASFSYLRLSIGEAEERAKMFI